MQINLSYYLYGLASQKTIGIQLLNIGEKPIAAF